MHYAVICWVPFPAQWMRKYEGKYFIAENTTQTYENAHSIELAAVARFSHDPTGQDATAFLLPTRGVKGTQYTVIRPDGASEDDEPSVSLRQSVRPLSR